MLQGHSSVYRYMCSDMCYVFSKCNPQTAGGSPKGLQRINKVKTIFIIILKTAAAFFTTWTSALII